jgi:protein ImuA
VDPVGLLLPALAPLSWEGRWVAWIGEGRPARDELDGYGFDSSRVLTARPRPGGDPLKLAERALAAGNCGAILVWLERLERFAVSRLHQAARGGDTAVFLFCPPGAMAQPLAGELRIYVSTHSRRLAVEILACRGGAGSVLQLAGDELADQGRPMLSSRPARGLPQAPRHRRKFTARPELVGN